uniref:C2 domain-containing protein n=1 Tax=Noccaea caerulescens TaxID=107243 RepID=A0A1J3E8T5_NOCCA
MECRPLDLTIISAEDLKDIQLIGKQDLYAVVSINGDERTKQKTKVDKDCGTKPKWKHQMKLTVDDSAARDNRLSLVIQIVANRPIAGDKPVGEVTVPVKELLDQNKTGDEEKAVTYAVRLPNGKAKGSLKFSFKFGEKYTYGSSSAPHAPGPTAVEHKTMDQPVTAHPPGQGAPSAYPPPGAGPSGYPQPGHDDKNGGVYGYPQAGGYPPPGGPGGYPPPGAYPQHGGYPAPQQGGYPGYPPQGPGYGYPGYPPQGPYGYPQQQAYGKPQKPKKSGGAGMGLGLGLGAGLLGGLLVGEAIDDMADMGGDFDF